MIAATYRAVEVCVFVLVRAATEGYEEESKYEECKGKEPDAVAKGVGTSHDGGLFRLLMLLFCIAGSSTARSFRCILDVGFQLGAPAAVERVDAVAALVAR